MYPHHKFNATLILALLIPLFFASCKSAGVGEDSAHELAADLTSALTSTIAQNPNLPGVTSSLKIAENAYSQRTEREKQLIAGRLYEGILRSLADRQGPDPGQYGGVQIPSADAIRAALATPFDATVAERRSFDQTLEAIESRVAQEPEYGQLLRSYSNRWAATFDPRDGGSEDFLCVIDGTEAPSWVCGNIIAFNLLDRFRIVSWGGVF